MKYSILLCLALAACSSASQKSDVREPQSDHQFFTEMVKIGDLSDAQRMGYYMEAEGVPFHGCVMYLEGLGDSMMNHGPLFNELSKAGYRVLAFDYLGQGGSEGSMTKTRITAAGAPGRANPNYEIGNQAKFVWQRYSEKTVFSRNCSQSAKRVIGWSTGGLAVYKLAHERWADAYVMMSPGIVPKWCVGESAKNCLKNLTTDQVITKETLNQKTYKDEVDPHVDPVRPTSVFYQVREFGTNLIVESYVARHWDISPTVKALVLLPGKNDFYVNAAKTKAVIQEHAPYFEVLSYPDSYHEIDNDVDGVDVRAKTVDFFNIETPS